MAKTSKKGEARDAEKSASKKAVLGVIGKDRWKALGSKFARRALLKVGRKMRDALTEATKAKVRSKIERAYSEVCTASERDASRSSSLDTGSSEPETAPVAASTATSSPAAAAPSRVAARSPAPARTPDPWAPGSRGAHANAVTMAASAAKLLRTPEEQARKLERERRFAAERERLSLGSPAGPTLRDLKTKNKRALGTSAELEKSYLRLTSAPEAAKVRPPAVLKEALALVKRKWRERRDYEHAKEQLKAIRQDLTVQHARGGALAQSVYETHARIALEVGDMAEYNQCQTVLRELHARRKTRGRQLPSPAAASSSAEASRISRGIVASESPGATIEEFAAYRVLYAAAQDTTEALTRELRRATADGLLEHPLVSHATAAASAKTSGNFRAFFERRRDAPRMSGYLMDTMAPGVRRSGMRAVLRAHGAGVSAAWVARVLGFEGDGDGDGDGDIRDGDGDIQDGDVRDGGRSASFRAFAAEEGVVFGDDDARTGEAMIDCRASLGLEPLPLSRTTSPAIPAQPPSPKKTEKKDSGRAQKRPRAVVEPLRVARKGARR